jgi:fatty acid synthase
MASVTAVIGRLLFIGSVTSRAIQFSSSKAPRVLLHAGTCSPAAMATYAFLKSHSLDILVTISNQCGSRTRLDSLPSEEYDVWSFNTRKRFVRGVDIAFDFREDINVAKETIQLLSRRGILVQIGGNRSYQVHHGQQYISVDYNSIVVDDESLDDVLDTIRVSVPASLMPRIEIYNIDQFISAQANACSSSTSHIAVLLNLEHVTQDLPVLRGGVIRGTEAFNPRASYVIIGGIGGLGASLARFLVENGARHIVLTSRSGEQVFATTFKKKLLTQRYGF